MARHMGFCCHEQSATLTRSGVGQKTAQDRILDSRDLSRDLLRRRSSLSSAPSGQRMYIRQGGQPLYSLHT